MKVLGLLAFLISTTAFSAPIDDGTEAKPQQFPSVVKIVTYDYEYGMEFDKYICTGTIIAPNFVLTAAHCVNHDKNRRQRVSLPGDEKGVSERKMWGFVEGGGIRVKKAYFSGQYRTNDNQLQAVEKMISANGFSSLPINEQLQWLNASSVGSNITSSYDIAILELDSPEPIKAEKISKLGCKTLPESTEVMIAGYGLDAFADPEVNGNSDYTLQFGFNHLTTPMLKGLTYFMDTLPGTQSINSGDSGGPLFRKNDSSVVYGVTSTKGVGEKLQTNGGTFASLASPSAKEIFTQFLANAAVPKTLKDLIRPCAK